MGDDFTLEKKLWEEKKGRLTWIGPSFEDCLEPATWATEEGEPEGKGRPPVFLRDEFAKEWMFSVKPLAFVNRLTLRRYAKDEFDVLVAPFSDVKDVAERLHKRLASAAETLAYEPGKESGLIPTGRGMGINLYRPSDVKPVKGDTKLWDEFMKHLIPNEKDRKQLLRWIATLVARPSIKMQYSVLLISEAQGVGKTTLAEKIVMPLVGKSNCSFPTAARGDHPSVHVVAPVQAARDHRRDIRRRVLEGIQQAEGRDHGRLGPRRREVREAVRRPELGPRPRQLQLVSRAQDRSQRPALVRAGSDGREVAGGEVGRAEHLARQRRARGDLPLGPRAREAGRQRRPARGRGPNSDAKRRSVVAAMSEGERIILDLGTGLKKSKEQHVVRMDKIRTWLAEMKSSDPRYGDSGGKFLETPETIGSTLRLAGLKVCKRRFKEDKLRFSVVANFVIDEKERMDDLKDKLLDPQKAYELDEELAEEKKQAEEDEPF